MLFKSFNKRIFITLLAAGIFYGLSYPPVNFYFLIFFSFIIIIDLSLNSKSLKLIFFNSCFAFFIACLVAVSWISLSGLSEGADPFLILGGLFVLIVYPLFFVIPVIVFFYVCKNFRHVKSKIYLFSFPFIWTAAEYALSLGQISFPWLFAGNSQSFNLEKIQFAEITGVFGVSFWICLISVFLYLLLSNIKNRIWKITSFKTGISVIAILILYFLPDLYSFFSISNEKYSGNKFGREINIGIIQPNINPWKKWGGKQSDLISKYTEDIKNIYDSNHNLDLIILPETALPYYFRENVFEDNYMMLKNTCDSLKTPLLIGTPDLSFYKDDDAPPDAKIMKLSGRKYDTFNSAFLFEPGKDKNSFQKHYKIKLVIGSERMPYQELLPFTKNLVEWGVGLSSWQLGNDTNIFVLKDGSKFNTAICYESVYPGFFADFVKKGAGFSVIITNDGWWGKLFGTYQHNRFAVFRAVENRRWIARCANTGISCFIDAYGNYYDETLIDEQKSIASGIGYNEEQTFYTINGDAFSIACLIIGSAVFLISFIIKMTISRD